MGELDDALRNAERDAAHREVINAWREQIGDIGSPTSEARCPHHDILEDLIRRLPPTAYTRGHLLLDPDNNVVFVTDRTTGEYEGPDDWMGRRRVKATMARRDRMGTRAGWFLIYSDLEAEYEESVNAGIIVADNGSIRVMGHLASWGEREQFVRACAHALQEANSTTKRDSIRARWRRT